LATAQAGTERCSRPNQKIPQRGGHNAVKPGTLIPRPHLFTKPGQVQDASSCWIERRCIRRWRAGKFRAGCQRMKSNDGTPSQRRRPDPNRANWESSQPRQGNLGPTNRHVNTRCHLAPAPQRVRPAAFSSALSPACHRYRRDRRGEAGSTGLSDGPAVSRPASQLASPANADERGEPPTAVCVALARVSQGC
jgi:hypothetical protein